MKISEIKETKTIKRPTRELDDNGNRVYEEIEFEINISNTIQEKGQIRLFAKIADILPITIALNLLFDINWFISILYSIPFVILTGTLTESLFGTTLGKYLFKLRVLDDFGNYPKFWKSLIRNILAIINFTPRLSGVATDIPTNLPGVYGRSFFSMHLNNKLCQTYVVNKSEFKKIKEFLHPIN